MPCRGVVIYCYLFLFLNKKWYIVKSNNFDRNMVDKMKQFIKYKTWFNKVTQSTSCIYWSVLLLTRLSTSIWSSSQRYKVKNKEI